jgi:hypothetical protein
MTTASNYPPEAGCTGRPSLRWHVRRSAGDAHGGGADAAPPTNDQTDTTAPIEEVVVTGSRIATSSLASVQ